MRALSRKPRLRLTRIVSFAGTHELEVVAGQELDGSGGGGGGFGRAFALELGGDDGVAEGEGFEEDFGYEIAEGGGGGGG